MRKNKQQNKTKPKKKKKKLQKPHYKMINNLHYIHDYTDSYGKFCFLFPSTIVFIRGFLFCLKYFKIWKRIGNALDYG